MKLSSRLLYTLVLLGTFAPSLSSAQLLHWSDGGALSVERSRVDGSDKYSLQFGTPFIVDMEFDEDTQKVYWLQASPGKIRRANFDFTDVEDLVSVSASGMNLDRTNKKIYWATSGSIRRSNYNGTSVETIFTPTRSAAEFSRTIRGKIAIDEVNGHVYFSTFSSYYDWTASDESQISRVDLSGGNLEVVQVGIYFNPIKGLAVDPNAERLYWSTDTPYDAGLKFDRLYRSSLTPLDAKTDFSVGFYNKISDIAVSTDKDTMCFSIQIVYPDNSLTNRIFCYRSSSVSSSFNINVAGIAFATPNGLAFQNATDELHWAETRTDFTRVNLRFAKGDSTLGGTLTRPFSVVREQNIRAPRGVAVDSENQRLFWVDATLKDIKGSAIGGGTPFTVLAGLGNPDGLSYDPVEDYVYWSDSVAGTISRVHPDGSGQETFVTGLGSPRMIDIDLTNRYLYWADSTAGKIQRSALDSPSAIDVVSSLDQPFDIAVYEAGGTVFWTEAGAGTIGRATLSGGSVTSLYSGLTSLTGIAVDDTNGSLFWGANGGNTLFQGSASGDAATEILTGVTKSVYDLNIPKEPFGELEVRGNGRLIPRNEDQFFFMTGQLMGTTTIDAPLQATFELRNIGAGELHLDVDGFRFYGPAANEFTLSTPPVATIAPGGSSSITVEFQASAAGFFQLGYLALKSDSASGREYFFKLSADAGSPSPRLFPGAKPVNVLVVPAIDPDQPPTVADGRDFGVIELGASASKDFTLLNYGSGGLLLQGSPAVSITGPGAAAFTVSAQPDLLTIDGSSQSTFSVVFSPTSISGGSQTFEASLSIDYNRGGGDQPFLVSITGTAQAADINLEGYGVTIADGAATPSLSDHTNFGSQSVSSGSIVRTFTIQNIGASELSISSVNITGPAAADYSVSVAPSATVASSGSTTFQVTFDPSALGARNATITITSSDPDEAEYDFAISGTGVDPEINLQGNGINIADGDATPSLANHTDFGSQSVASGTVVRTFTIQNTGSATLVVSSVNITGAAAADYSVSSVPSATVVGGGATTFQVTFNPGALGSRNATITIGSNDADESVYDFSITGTGVDPEINVQGNGVTIVDGDATPSATDHTDFGSQSVASGSIVRTFTIQNTGTANLIISSVNITGTAAADYSVTATPAGLVAPTGSTTFQVTFNPAGVGSRNATITISSNDADEAAYDFAVTGTGVDPEINVQGNGVSIVDGDATPSTTDHTDFGSQSVASGSIVRTFTIQNTGTANLIISSVNITGTAAADYSVTVAPAGSVAPSGTTTFQVTFDPSAPGARNATITIANNDPDESTYDFAVSGTGVDPEINVSGNGVSIADGDGTPSLADHTDFGSQSVTSGTVVRTFTIQNTGSASLVVSSVNLTGLAAADFAVTTAPAPTVVGSGSTTFQVTFNPSALGSRDATVTINNNDADEGVYTFAVSGTGVDPEISVQGNSVTIANGDSSPSSADHTDFGSQLVSVGSVIQTFTIRNIGSADLAVSAVNISGLNASDFELAVAPATTIPAGDSTTFQVRFDPSALTTRTATITVLSNDPAQATYAFAISGTGVEPEIVVEGNGIMIANSDTTPSATDGTDFGEQTIASGTVARTFTIRNTGTADLLVTQVQVTGSTEFIVSAMPSSSIAAGTTSTFEVTFDPAVLGTRAAQVAIQSSDVDEPTFQFAVSGIGTGPEINLQGNSISIANNDTTPSVDDHTDFGAQRVSSGTVVRTFTIQNTGTSELVLSTVDISGTGATDFSLTAPSSLNIAASDSVTFQVTFDPSVPEVRSAQVTITSNDADEGSYQFAIIGAGIEPEIELQGNNESISSGDLTPSDADHTDFGPQAVSGGPIARTFTVQNLGNTDLLLSGTPTVLISGADAADFAVTAQPASPVAASGSTTFVVQFDPSAPGLRSALISIANDDADENPYTFQVQGIGTEPEIEVLGNSFTIANGDVTPSVADDSDFGEQEVAVGTVLRTFTVRNNGDFDLVLTGTPQVTVSGPNASDFTVVTQPTTPVSPAGTTTFVIEYDPSVVGLSSAIISIANDDVDQSPYTFAVQGTGIAVLDSDGDGVVDAQEVIDGTDPNDAGSLLQVLGTTVCSEWNGFLGGMLNIMEHVNTSSDPLTFDTTLFSNSGVLQSALENFVLGKSQSDLLVHEMPGYSLDSYGRVCSQHSGSPGDIDGRMVNYKLGPDGIEFAFAVPFNNPVGGSQFLLFNTFQPSLDPEDARNFVANWIQLTNSDVTAQSGVLYYYAQDGTTLGSEVVILAAGVRRDFAVHQFGQSLVGLIEWRPDSPAARFQVRAIRYYYDNATLEDSFSSACHLEGRKGIGTPIFASVDTREGTAVVEIANTRAATQVVEVRFYAADGALVRGLTLNLDPRATVHIPANNILPAAVGSVAVLGSIAEGVVATVMQYGRSSSGSIDFAFGTDAIEALGSNLTGSYNTFLSQGCDLLLVNRTSSATSVQVSIRRFDGTVVLTNQSIAIAANGTQVTDICAHDESDVYGSVTVVPAQTNSVVAHVVRKGSGGSYRFSTPVRQ